MGDNKNKIESLIIVLFMSLSMSVCAQNATSDSVMARYNRYKVCLENGLKDYRVLIATGQLSWFNVYYQGLYAKNQQRFYKGVDLSLDGMVDSVMRKRIIQLLNDEYSDGEFVRWIDTIMAKYKNIYKSREDAIEFTKEKKWNGCNMQHLIELCGGIKDDKIRDILINIYEDDKTREDYKYTIFKELARMGVDQYLSMFVKSNEYDNNDEPEEMGKSIMRLASIPCKNTLLEISNYLSTEKYEVLYIESDMITKDTIYIDEDIEIVPFEIEYYDPEPQPPLYDYIKTTAFLCLARHILNPELLSIVGVKRDEELFLYSTREKLDALLTPRKCRKIQRWMKKNYNNYDLSGSW